MTRANNLYLINGTLPVAFVGVGFYVYREETKPKSIKLGIGQNGIKAQEK
ncbi:hypothetical protein [Neorhizobium sp. T25_13]|nr:hypothetical protein [Neorhizobium sp. T25_13]